MIGQDSGSSQSKSILTNPRIPSCQCLARMEPAARTQRSIQSLTRCVLVVVAVEEPGKQREADHREEFRRSGTQRHSSTSKFRSSPFSDRRFQEHGLYQHRSPTTITGHSSPEMTFEPVTEHQQNHHYHWPLIKTSYPT